MKNFTKKLSLVPTKPGSYQMKNKDGIIIYVGKAKNLQKRLKSYFTKTLTGKTKMLVDDIDDFEYIVTSSELESLILEITLIKKYSPKYNILLRDDKTYPYIELTKDKYPILRVIRNKKRLKNKNYLFGPYPNVKSARRTVEIINRLYPLRKCNPLAKELCLYYHIKQCLGYCKIKIEQEKIDNMTKEIKTFLKGDSKEVIKKIMEEITKASNDLNFERALELKEMLTDIETTLKKQQIDLNNNYNFDLINYYQNENYLSIEIFFIREGLLFGRHNEIINIINLEDELVEFIIKFYDKQGINPSELYISNNNIKNLLEEYFKIKVNIPQRGKIKKLLEIAYENAKNSLEEKSTIISEEQTKRITALNELSNLLKIDKVSKIESYDNSHLFGTYYVGVKVLFEDFIPKKDQYRKYKLDAEVKNDIAAMKEVIYRRFFKLIMEKEEKPDLIIMDGGVAQINICKEVLNSLNLNIKVVGLVKNSKHKTSELIDSDGKELTISKNSNLFIFLNKIQNEVHRFAITYHRNLKTKTTIASKLELIDGIGQVRRKELIKKFGSLKRIKEAKLEELEEILPKDLANKIKIEIQDL